MKEEQDSRLKACGQAAQTWHARKLAKDDVRPSCREVSALGCMYVSEGAVFLQYCASLSMPYTELCWC